MRFEITPMPDGNGHRVGIAYSQRGDVTTYVLSDMKELILQAAHTGGRKALVAPQEGR